MTVDDLWDDLFGCDPTPQEEAVMRGLGRHLGPADEGIIQAAIVVHFLSQVLLQYPASPIRIAGRAGLALEQLEARLTELNRRVREVDANFVDLRREVWITREVLKEARTLGKQLKIPAPVLQVDPHTGSPYWHHTLAPNALRRIAMTTFASAFAACAIFTAALRATGWIG